MAKSATAKVVKLKPKAPATPATYVVESGVPMPTSRSRFPFAAMGIGDSFTHLPAKAAQIRSNAYLYGKRHGMKFAAKGNRIWRIA